jgi:phosphate uptake regulator
MAEKFHTELKNLKTETLEMANLGRFMLRTAVDALIRQDPELAESVIVRKGEIHDLEVT